MRRASCARRRTGWSQHPPTARVERGACAPPHSVTRGDTSAKSRHVRMSISGRYLRTRRSVVLHPLQKRFVFSPLHTPMHAFHHKIAIWPGLSSRGTHARRDPHHYTKVVRFPHVLHPRYGPPAELDAAPPSPTSSPKASCLRHLIHSRINGINTAFYPKESVLAHSSMQTLPTRCLRHHSPPAM